MPSLPSRCFSLFIFFFLLVGCDPPTANLAPPLFPGSTARSSMECIEIQTSLGNDDRLPETSALLWFEFENRCDAPVMMDWRRVKVTATVERERPVEKDGAEVREPELESLVVGLVPTQPTNIELGRIDARQKGEEGIRFDVIPTDLWRGVATKRRSPRHQRRPELEIDAWLTKVCIDLSGVAVAKKNDVFCIEIPKSPAVETKTPPPTNLNGERSWDRSPQSFGAMWNSAGWPALTIDTGLTMHSIGLQGRELSGGGLKIDGSRIADRVIGGTFDFRMKGFVHGPFYVGGNVSAGFGGSKEVTVTQGAITDTVSKSPSGIVVFDAFAGIAGRARFIQPFAEIGGGANGLLFSMRRDDGVGEDRTKLSSWWGTITPRAGVDVWIHPHITLGLHAGFDATHTENWFGGIRLLGHLRALDGR